MTFIHSRLAMTVLYYCSALALWGLWRFFRRQGIDSNYWGALAIGEVLLIAQGVLGVILLLGAGASPGRSIHILYGAIGALTIPAVYVYTKGGDQRRDMLIYAVVMLFQVAILVRALMTGY